MSRKPTSIDGEAREAAERSMPGWKAVEQSDAARPSPAPRADFVGKDIAALKQKYLGLATDAAGQRFPNDDAKFVELRPKSGDAPVRTRKVLVAGKEVVGFQG